VEKDDRIVVGAGMPTWWEPAPRTAGSAAAVGGYNQCEGLPPAGTDGPRGVPH
jgi:hypothetical protein